MRAPMLFNSTFAASSSNWATRCPPSAFLTSLRAFSNLANEVCNIALHSDDETNDFPPAMFICELSHPKAPIISLPFANGLCSKSNETNLICWGDKTWRSSSATLLPGLASKRMPLAALPTGFHELSATLMEDTITLSSDKERIESKQ